MATVGGYFPYSQVVLSVTRASTGAGQTDANSLVPADEIWIVSPNHPVHAFDKGSLEAIATNGTTTAKTQSNYNSTVSTYLNVGLSLPLHLIVKGGETLTYSIKNSSSGTGFPIGYFTVIKYKKSF